MRFHPLLCLTLLPATLHAAIVPGGGFSDPHPAPGNHFGAAVVPLANGNVAISAPGDDAGGEDAGAVYLFSGSTGALISTLTGGSAGDAVGSGGLTGLTGGNFVVCSPWWQNGAATYAGAVTWI